MFDGNEDFVDDGIGFAFAMDDDRIADPEQGDLEAVAGDDRGIGEAYNRKGSVDGYGGHRHDVEEPYRIGRFQFGVVFDQAFEATGRRAACKQASYQNAFKKD